jgi:hypothetical protein
MPECPICASTVPSPKESLDFTGYDCSRCGRWSVEASSSSVATVVTRFIGEWAPPSLQRRSRISHLLRRQQPQLLSSSRWIKLQNSDIERVAATDELLPSPIDQLSSLVLLIGDNQPSTTQPATLTIPSISAWIGAAITHPSSDVGLSWLLEQPTTRELIQSGGAHEQDLPLRLSMPGWLRYEELKRHRVASRKVLMAMKFDDNELDTVFSTCFVPAVRRTGFQLRRATDDQPAGLIDDQLRVALRTSRFVIADLTHENNGAYWEADLQRDLDDRLFIRAKRQSGGRTRLTLILIT